MKPLAFFLVLVAFLFPAVRASGQPPQPPRPAADIGAAPVELGPAVAATETVFRAFVPTESTSSNCLATLRESSVATTPMNLFCAPRRLGGVNGVLVSIFFSNAVPSDAVVGITLYQEGARGYGTPVLFPE